LLNHYFCHLNSAAARNPNHSCRIIGNFLPLIALTTTLYRTKSFETKDRNKMSNAEQYANASASNTYGPGRTHTAETRDDDLAAKGVAAFREAQASVESVIADAGKKGQQTLAYAGQKGQEVINNVRDVGDTLAVAIEKSVKTRPYTTIALVMAAGFLIGATWRR
jgi:ElaB/YqjD/DUF883 family membrane-anchored ribosome-binding protein